MSTALANVSKNTAAATAASSDPYLPRTWEQALTLAEGLANSGIVPNALAGKPGAVFAILMAGNELGLSPMKALRGIDVVEGKPRISSDLAVALVKAHADCEYFQLVETTEELATFVTKRRSEPQPTKMTYTIEQAKVAGLTTKKGAWQSHPAVMLRHRAARALAHAVYQDVLFGLGDPEDEPAQAAAPQVQVVAPVIAAAAAPAPRAMPKVIDVPSTPAPARPMDAAVTQLEADRARGVTPAPASVVGGATHTPAGVPVGAQVAFPLGAQPKPNSPEDIGFKQPAPEAPPADAAPERDEFYPERFAQMMPLIDGAASKEVLREMLKMAVAYRDKGEMTAAEYDALKLRAKDLVAKLPSVPAASEIT